MLTLLYGLYYGPRFAATVLRVHHAADAAHRHRAGEQPAPGLHVAG